MCHKENTLDESLVKNKQYYVRPYSCMGGDYYNHAYYWFSCECGRVLKVVEEHLSQPYKLEKEYSEHVGCCSYKKHIKDLRREKLSNL
jgi:hypothetical protein